MIFDLIRYLFKNKKLWLIPFIIVMLLLGSFLIITQGTVLSPFIYSLV